MPVEEAIVRLRGPDTPWLHLGHDTAARGVVAEDITLTANEQGPDTASFTLKRSPRYIWPDIRAHAFCEIEIGGVVVWGGRIWETPGQDGEQRSLSVTGRGWQYHLDDDPLAPFFVSSDLSRFRDMKEISGQNLQNFDAAWNIHIGSTIAMEAASGVAYDGATYDPAGGVVADYGASGVKRALMKLDKSQGSSGWQSTTNSRFVLRATETPYTHGATGEGSFQNLVDQTVSATTSGTWYGGTATTAKRYLAMFTYYAGTASGTRGAGDRFTLDDVLVVSDTAYESGNASDLTADEVFTYVRGSGAVPLLSTDESLIDATTFDIPEMGYQDRPVTPRQILAAANAYHDNLWGVDARRRLYFTARPTAATLEMGEWSGATVSDAGLSGEGIYNQVTVSYTDAGGFPQAETRTQTSSLLDRLGFDRTYRLDVRAALTQAAAQQIGDVWISEFAVPRFKGSVTLAGTGAVRNSTGGGIPPAHLLTKVGQLIRLTDRPGESGEWGRDGRIKAVSYNHDANSATVSLDNERGRFSALLERLAVVQGQVR